MMPFVPHLACECLSKLEGSNFYEEIQWPKGNKSLLNEQEVTLVVQINGKKRGLIKSNLNVTEKDLLNLINENPEIKKYLEGNTIKNKIFIPNKLINIII